MIDYVGLGDARAILRRYGWSLREPGLLDQSLRRPRASMYGTELYPGLLPKAAALMDSVNRLHPLVDGNKRLSWILVLRFLDLNGLTLEATDDDAERFVLTVAGEHLPLEDIAGWFADHVVTPGGGSSRRR